jgi:tRNA(adenine34) deaminase
MNTASIGSDPIDQHWMRHALALAQQAAAHDEVPVGAVLVAGDRLLAEGRNGPIAGHDPTAHAEIVCLRAAGQALANYRLTGTTLYVTLEPCLMCVGAIVHARVERLVFGAPDPKSGAVTSVCRGFELPGLNHRVQADGEVLAAECGALLQDFFRARRGSTLA